MLALVSDAFGGRGGIAQYNRDFLGAVAASPAISAIDILPRHTADSFTLPPKVRQAPPGTNRLSYIARALRMARDEKPGIVFCGHINLAPLAAAAARLCGAKMVVQTHGIDAWDRPGDMYRKAVEKSDLVLCVSRYTRARLLSWAAMPPERVVVLSNTVGQAFTPGDASQLRRKWKLDGKRVLLTVARTEARERYKGHERVIAALPALPRDIVYVVLGDGNDLERIKDVAFQAGVGERVYFKHGVNRETLISAYRMADLYVMPSTGEGFGIAFLEAMASGTPALGLAVAGATDALCDGALGAAVSEADFTAALARQMAGPRPDPQALSAAVVARFGIQTFTACAQGALSRLAA
jgi:phosphatidylinositol alpha-1,6-mannosyltransferase